MTRPLEEQGSSTRPYLIRALHDWCTDNGFTPYLAVHVDETVQVPREYVKDNEIVLNVGFEATSGLELGNDEVSFKARFGGVARDIRVPIDHVVAIYARENGQGMAFPMPAAKSAALSAVDGTGDAHMVPEDHEAGGADQAGGHADASHERSPKPATLQGGAGVGAKSRAPLLAIVPASEDAGSSGIAGAMRPEPDSVTGSHPPEEPTTPDGGGRPTLKRIK